MAGRINKSILKNEIASTQFKALEKEARLIANKILEDRKKEYISEILDHPVSKELADGPEAENISNTLNGEGNLYSFIGFDAGDRPIENLIDIVDRNTRVQPIKSKGDVFNFQVYTPSLDELKGYTPMPFEGGNSWLKGIEKGISGFSNYLYGLLFPTSRSGRGIQSKNKIRRISYKPTKYFSVLYKNFIESFK
jgi:hypothetical protein